MSNDKQKPSFWAQSIMHPELPPAPVDIPQGPTESIFTPKFIRALQTLTGAMPALNVEAKNTTLADLIFRRKAFREDMFRLALLLCSTVAEMVDRERNPRLFGFMRFTRNVLALEQLRQHIISHFSVKGGTNLETWNQVVKAVCGDDKVDIDYVPPGIDRLDTLLMPLDCVSISGDIMYAMYECDREGKTLDITAGIMGGTFIPPDMGYTAKSVFRYSPEIHIVEEENQPLQAIRGDDGKDWYWLQVFEIKGKDLVRSDVKGYLVFKLLRLKNEESSKKITPLFMTVDLIVQNPVKDSSPTEDYMSPNYIIPSFDSNTPINPSFDSNSLTVEWRPISNALQKTLKYSMFDPRHSIINATITYGGNDGLFFRRPMKFSGQDCVHAMQEYDTIRDGIRKCMDKGINRGYAFVGAPGTGKTIMMNQLVNEFLDYPVIHFRITSLMDSVTPQYNAASSEPVMSMTERIVGIMSSLKGAGFNKVFLCCDDIDSTDLSEKNSSVEKIISLMDTLHYMTALPTVIFMTTINDPASIHSTIIKRGQRIDEVIEVPYPDASTIKRLINKVKLADDPTDYEDLKYKEAIDKMVEHNFTLADLSTLMANMQIYCTPEEDGTYCPADLDKALDKILSSRENASKTYD